MGVRHPWLAAADRIRGRRLRGCIVLSERLLGPAVGLTVAVTGLAIIAVLVLQIRHPGRPARIAMIVSGGVIATAGIAATVFDEVALGVALAVFGSLQVVAGVLLLLGRLLEPLVVALGVIYLGGGAAAITVGEWPSYGIAFIALGLALTVHGVSGRLPVLVRRLSRMLTAPA